MKIAKSGEIRYLRVPGEGIEIVACENCRFSYPLHNHVSAFVVGMVLSGTVRITLNGRATEFARGGIFVVPPYAPHAIESRGPCTMISVCVDKTAASRSELHPLKAVVAQALHKTPACRRLSRVLLARLGRALDLLEKTPPRAPARPHIETLRTRLESHPEVDLSVEEMSRSAHAGKCHLIRSFRRAVGLTPHRFQIQNRVRMAQRLLEHSASMTEAALAAGFADQSHFIRQFKKVVGMTPTSYLAACESVEGGDELREEK